MLTHARTSRTCSRSTIDRDAAAQYAIYLGWCHHKPAPISGPAAALVAGLAFLNGQYYMQKVVANTAIKVAAPTC